MRELHYVGVALCGSCVVGELPFGEAVLWGSCVVQELHGRGVVFLGSLTVGKSCGLGLVVRESCVVWELRCVRVALWGSRSVWGSRWLLKLNSLRFWRYFTFPRFFRLRKNVDYLKNVYWPNRLPWLIFQGIWNRQGC